MSQPAAEHDRELATAFDGQSAQFEVAPVQSDPDALDRLVRFADLPGNSLLFDAGCGPGLVASVFLGAGHRVVGVDLSGEMVTRAVRRCEPFGDRARFRQGSLYDEAPEGPFDAVISRYVLHHIADPVKFVRRQVELLRPGGVLVLSDHTTDPDPAARAWHQQIERLRDRTHTANPTPGALVDLFDRAGLDRIGLADEPFTLDFDEWFDRGTPAEPKEMVLTRMLAGPQARGFRAHVQPDGSVKISCRRALVRGVKP